MSKIVGKISRLPKTLYEHKKKTVFFSFLGYLGANWVYQWDKNQGIRKRYALIARKFGDQTVSPEVRPKRIFVLVNVEGNSRSCFDAFNKNALPLFHLAGLQVDVIKADNEVQMEALAGAVDTQEADVLYVVGGDGTIGKVVTGIFRNRDKAPIPVGFYPGGYDNLWLKRMVPSVFQSSEDVRHACETAMAVIEDQKSKVYAFEMTTEGAQQPEYGLSDVSAGWFRQIEDTRKKFWYFSMAKRHWAYIWEMLKRSPTPIECHVEYEETCAGCEKCRPKPVVQAPQWRWWHVLTGPPKYKNNDAVRDFTGIVNEKCGQKHELEASGAELLIENEQMGDYSQVHFRMGGAGRFGVVSDGFNRCSTGVVGESADEKFYTTDIHANAVSFKLSALPTYIQRLYVSSIPTPKDAELIDKKISIRGTQKRLDVFLPTGIRFEL
uniref:DAGKc domain-containing protein n=1 Tax=Caenorhabditis japonica TaxID=281687 RepID=A0A8R1HJK8_CAEJA